MHTTWLLAFSAYLHIPTSEEGHKSAAFSLGCLSQSFATRIEPSASHLEDSQLWKDRSHLTCDDQPSKTHVESRLCTHSWGNGCI